MSTGNVPGHPLYAEHYPVPSTARSRIGSLSSLPGCFMISSSNTPIMARPEVNQTFLFPANSAPNPLNLSPQTSRTFLPVISPLTNNPLPPTGVIGIFAQLTIAGAARIVCLGYADTDTCGVRFTFRARGNAAWYQIIFIGDDVATAVVNNFTERH